MSADAPRAGTLFARELGALSPLDESERATVECLRKRVRSPHSHLKSSGPAHFTASAIVVDASHTYVALHLHKKVGAWLQFGGHVEQGEQSFLEAALREVREESGLECVDVLDTRPPGERVTRETASPFRVHSHTLNRNFSVCREHWDVQFLMRSHITPRTARDGLVLSHESAHLQWWPLSDLPGALAPDLIPALGHDVPRALAQMQPRQETLEPPKDARIGPR